MPPATKKRKTGKDATALATLSKSPGDISLLRRILNKSHTPNVMRTLNESLDTAAPEDVQALKRLLEPLVKAVATPLHCVRCHAAYNESENHNKACSIGHEEIEHAYKARGGIHFYRATCCSEEFEEDHISPCYVAAHTTNPLEVRYYVDREDEDEEADNSDYEGDYPRNRSVRTCAYERCGEK
ncbi:hypothetical protein BDV93DRAFT_588198 [Ceratobasidium sp. AG-I]|nr:hypothetical protein BDV93DRAFT_588198 [Ceratobasidium sp. AG-I]